VKQITERLRIGFDMKKTNFRAGPGPGRPRSEETHQAILRAALGILAEEGWSGFTMQGIAARAGVGKAAIYRRWKSREAVLAAAVEGMVGEIGLPDSGSVRTDLLELMHRAVGLYRGASGSLMPGLVSAMARHPEVASAVRTAFLAPRRAALRTVLRRGIDRGELRADIDQELALDFLGGPLFYRLLITGGSLDQSLAKGTVDVMLRGLAPHTDTPSSGGGHEGPRGTDRDGPGARATAKG
jgi:AcrR family transcriptional regulator